MRALVIGLAETGVAVARRLRAEGWDVVVAEDTPAATDTYRSRREAVAAVGATVLEAPERAALVETVAAVDLVVPSPLVRPDHPALAAAREAGTSVRSEIDLAADRTRARLVAVTGTNGKTTVTSLIARMLEASGRRALAAGNIGRPLIDAADDDVEVLVAEVSSFQLAMSATFRPEVAVLLAITPDHLDWHGDFRSYVDAKANICRRQSGDDLLVFDADDPEATAVAQGAPAARVGVTADSARDDCYRVDGDALRAPGPARDEGVVAPIALLRRALPHDLTNALAAAAAARRVGATVDGTRAALRDYETLPHRVALVGEAGGVRWYDDSKATNPDAALVAMSGFDSVVLLAGGRNKGLDLSVLTREAGRARAVVAFGEAGPEIADAFAGKAEVRRAANMHDAVHAAAELARPGDVVLLSPACASFDAYSGYAARGDDFAAEVHALIGSKAAS